MTNMRLRLPTIGTQAIFFGLAIICIVIFSLINAICAIFADNLKTYFLISSFCFVCLLGLSGLFIYLAPAKQSFGFWATLLLIILYLFFWLMAMMLRQFLIHR